MVVLNVSDAIKLEIGENDDNNGNAGQAAAAAERKQRVREREREHEMARTKDCTGLWVGAWRSIKL